MTEADIQEMVDQVPLDYCRRCIGHRHALASMLTPLKFRLTITCRCRTQTVSTGVSNARPRAVRALLEGAAFTAELPGQVRCCKCAEPLGYLLPEGAFACNACQRQVSP